MNERIAKLYDQAMEQHISNNSAWEELNPEKFAELIVRESATFINVEMSLGGVDGRSLLEHFGLVE